MTPAKILVTGATGFIGSRLCERLSLHYQLPYRALVRSFTRANRIARMGAELFGGDLADPSSILTALEGCDAVVHLAHSDYAAAPQETKNILAACRQTGIQRFVHISSIAVHGPAPGLESTHEETATIRRYGEEYCDSKAAVEELVQQAVARHNFPAVILRPTVVYGPYSSFVESVVRDARKGDIVLIDEGKWTCNAVYIDDVCDAIRAALARDEALGQACFVAANQAITWREFILGFARMTQPLPAEHSVTSEAVRRHWASRRPTLKFNLAAARRLALSPEFHKALETVPVFRATLAGTKKGLLKYAPESVVRRLIPGSTRRPRSAANPPLPMPNAGRLIRETCAVAFSNALAKRLLAWEPRYDSEQGAALTKTWLEFARMLSPEAQ